MEEKFITAILTQAVEDARYIGFSKKYLKHKIEAINWIMSNDPQFKYFLLFNIFATMGFNKTFCLDDILTSPYILILFLM